MSWYPSSVRFANGQWRDLLGDEPKRGWGCYSLQVWLFHFRSEGQRRLTRTMRAADVSLTEALALLRGTWSEVVANVLNDKAVLWIGSGVSRERFPAFPDLLMLLLERLHQAQDTADPNCPARAMPRCQFRYAIAKVGERPQPVVQCKYTRYPAENRSWSSSTQAGSLFPRSSGSKSRTGTRRTFMPQDWARSSRSAGSARRLRFGGLKQP